MEKMNPSDLTLKFDEKGLVPAIIQDADSCQVLMLGYMNRESFERTLASGEVWFYSRSRQELWHKGDTSGVRIHVRSISIDCDEDAILVQAKATGPVCHTGNTSCLFRDLTQRRPQ